MVYNVMVKAGYDWWYTAIVILVEWVVYVMFAAKVLPWLVKYVNHLERMGHHKSTLKSYLHGSGFFLKVVKQKARKRRVS